MLPDYVAVVVRMPDGLFPILRQYSPAVEAYTWEFPAGLLEPGEDPAETCARELREETGLSAGSITPLGSFYADTGRLANRLHAFFVEAGNPEPGFLPEPGVELKLVTLEELCGLIQTGAFSLVSHIGVLLLAQLHGKVDCSRALSPKVADDSPLGT